MTRSIARPVIGIIGNSQVLNGNYPVQAMGDLEARAVAKVALGLPLMIPADPAVVSVADLLDSCDGFIFTGARPNVHPEEYGEAETEAHGVFDRNRDAVTLPLIRACIARGQPIFGICRGFQEMNVALGGSLHPEIREIPGRMNHRMPPEGSIEEIFALRHKVTFGAGGPFEALMGRREVMTNTLHGQGIKTPGARVVVDGTAEDGTPEAIFVKEAAGHALGVQWHPEWRAEEDPVSRALFAAFGQAARAWAALK